jgi:hypothetical protein
MAFPTNKSGFWTEEELPEEVMVELRKEAKKEADAVTSSFREKQRELARRKSEADARQFDAVRRKSAELADKVGQDLKQLTSQRRSTGSAVIARDFGCASFCA